MIKSSTMRQVSVGHYERDGKCKQGKRSSLRPRHKCQDNSTVDFRELGVRMEMEFIWLRIWASDQQQCTL
jgi:hypothetical protein